VLLKSVYILWDAYSAKVPKSIKYSLGIKVSNLLIDTIEAVAIATFLQRTEKLPYLKKAVARVDTVKVFLQMLWEMKLLSTKHYAELSEKLSDAGKMLGGWYGQVLKQNQAPH
jgi:hypothetical protein